MKNGFTTGTCAQAAVKGACIMLTNKRIVDEVEVETPSGVKLNLVVADQKIGKDFAACSVKKISGEEPDVTNGAKIFAKVKLSARNGVVIKGGEGIGRITKPGLAMGVGEWAINPVPREMILKEVNGFLPRFRTQEWGAPKKKGLEVIISVPGGEEIAKKTYNPKLGITGGISIIGTTGIVKPKALDAYRASLEIELNVLKAQGYAAAVFVLGYVGERYCEGKFKEDSIIKIGDHVGFMLKQCAKKKIKKVLLIGHIGKMIKVAGGQFNTHCDYGDKRVSLIARYAKLAGADKRTIKDISGQTAAEAVIEILKKAKLEKVFDLIAKDVSVRCKNFARNKVKVNCVILSLEGKVLGSSRSLESSRVQELTPKLPNSQTPKLSIIGVGPGTDDYVLPVARREIESADCLIGAKRYLSLFRGLGKEEVLTKCQLNFVTDYIKKHKNKKKIAVLVSGDPGMYSLLGKISKTLKPDEYIVIPGISTVQLAFAKIGRSWSDAKIISLHARDMDNLADKIADSAKVFLFTGPKPSPDKIAEYLLKEGLDNRRVVIFENLSYPNERVIDTDLKHLSRMKGFGMCSMIIMSSRVQEFRRSRVDSRTLKLSNSETHKLYGLGIGPGDPKLVTLKAKEILDRVDTVFVPKSSDDGTSWARSIVEAVTTTQKNFVELTFPMTKDKAVLSRYWKKAADIIAKKINKGGDAAFVTIGDPFVYSTYVYLQKTLKKNFPNIKVETVPGISAFNAAASAADFSLVEGDERMAIVPVTKDLKNVRETLEEFDTIVLMKVGSKLDSIIALLKEMNLLKRVVLVSRVGHRDEKIINNLATLRDKKIGYLSVILIKKAISKKRE